MLAIKLFGTTTVTTPHGTVQGAGLGGVKPRQILEILALAPGSAVPKDHLADLLWDGRPPRCCLATLESYVCILRKSLGLDRGRKSAIATVMRGYVLDPDAVQVDLIQFRDRVGAADVGSADPGPALRRLEEAVALVDGDFLADETYATWAIRERDIFQHTMVTVTTHAAGLAIQVGRVDAAVRMAGIAISHDELAEDAWRFLMQAQSASGRPAEALRAYASLRAHLSCELGSDPSAETSDLYLRILRATEASGGKAHGQYDARDEARVLMNLLRQAVAAIPGGVKPRTNRALDEMAADLVA